MGGAILVAAPAFALARRRKSALLGGALQVPERRDIDTPLVAGSIVFGIGWGLAGFCPGPALVAAGMAVPKALAFVLAMAVGMALYELWTRVR
jgi:hypothetical protein